MPERTVSKGEIVACAGVFGLLCLRTLASQYSHLHQAYFTDDAFYYLVVARNLAHDGLSTFDGITLTNGYHPLWMALLALQVKVLGQSLVLARCIEFLLCETALIFALLLVRLPNLILNVVFTMGFFAVLSRLSLNGMETALFSCCFAVFSYVSLRQSEEKPSNGIVDGILAVAAIASRIDAVVFVLPQMLLTARSRYRRVCSLAIVLLCGGAYAFANHYYFGVTMPISGEVKSLGGLQLNWALFRFLGNPNSGAVKLCYATGVMFIIALFLVRRVSPYVHRPIVIAFLAGSVIYGIRLAFMSSWVIWAWYDYPLVIGYIACVPSILVMLTNGFQARPVYSKLVRVGALAIFVVAAFPLVGDSGNRPSLSSAKLRTAPADLPKAVGAVLDGARVAMGDRAGSFAYSYPGSVSQLEGLMNDAQYLHILRSKRDVRELLCERKVQFVVAYEADLVGYKVHLVHTIRPELSQYPAPEIEVLRDDQVLRMPDLSQNQAAGSKYLYVWKLRCGASREPYAGSSQTDAGNVGRGVIPSFRASKVTSGAE